MNRNPLGNAVGLLAFSLCVLMVASLLLPEIGRQRQATRGSACSNNLRQIGLGMHNYHSAYKQLPPGTSGTTGNPAPEKCNSGRLGPLVAITPFVEQQRLWEMISNPYINPDSAEQYPPMGPVPWHPADKYRPWGMAPSVYQCPDTFGETKTPAKPRVLKSFSPESNRQTITSYVACHGDGTFLQAEQVRTDVEAMRRKNAGNRGIFVPAKVIKFRDILDGLSNTVMYSEVVASRPRKAGASEVVRDVAGLSMNPSLCLSAAKSDDADFWPFGRGALWADGFLPISGFQTVLPPNSPSCTSDLGIEDPVVSASSRHAGGVHVLLSDGAVQFVTNSIDTGDLTKPGVTDQPGYSPPGSRSPYGIWGALGSRAAAEIIGDRRGGMLPAPRVSSNELTMSPTEVSYWKQREGNHSISAKFIQVIDKKTLQLQSIDGTIYEVPLDSLHDKYIYRAVQMDLNRKQRKE